MDLDSFLIEQNAWRYYDRLDVERDPADRAMLSKLLLEEEDRFARQAGRLDALESFIARCDAQIAKCRELMERGGYSPEAAELFNCTMQNMAAIRKTLHSVKATIAAREAE